MQPVDIDIRKQIITSNGNIAVSAGAGTGKTYITLQKIVYEIQVEHTFKTFAAITFTRKAAKELQNERPQHNKQQSKVKQREEES